MRIHEIGLCTFDAGRNVAVRALGLLATRDLVEALRAYITTHLVFAIQIPRADEAQFFDNKKLT